MHLFGKRRNPPQLDTLPKPGLFSKNGARLPLLSVSVNVEISHFLCQSTLTQVRRFFFFFLLSFFLTLQTNKQTKNQEYKNQSKDPLEIFFHFLKEERIAVCGFEATVEDGQKVVGKIMDKKKALEGVRIVLKLIEFGLKSLFSCSL
jgi:hypothetical protein